MIQSRHSFKEALETLRTIVSLLLCSLAKSREMLCYREDICMLAVMRP